MGKCRKRRLSEVCSCIPCSFFVPIFICVVWHGHLMLWMFAENSLLCGHYRTPHRSVLSDPLIFLSSSIQSLVSNLVFEESFSK